MVGSNIVGDDTVVVEARRFNGDLVFMGGRVGGNIGGDIDVATVVEVRRLEDEDEDEDDASV
jgi:hypothetical protein